MQVKSPDRAQSVCTQLMRPTEADSKALAKIFLKAPNVNILKQPPPAFDPTAKCVVWEQKRKKKSCYFLFFQTEVDYHRSLFDEAIYENFAKGKSATRLYEAESGSERQAVMNNDK